MAEKILITGISGSGGSYLAEHIVNHHPDVEVHGIGSDATVTSRDTSTFDVNIETTMGSNPSAAESTATANGAAGANLSTASFANQSQATTASAFMQAFGSASEVDALSSMDLTGPLAGAVLDGAANASGCTYSKLAGKLQAVFDCAFYFSSFA